MESLKTKSNSNFGISDQHDNLNHSHNADLKSTCDTSNKENKSKSSKKEKNVSFKDESSVTRNGNNKIGGKSDFSFCNNGNV